MLEVTELIKKVRQVEIAAKKSVNELFFGQYKSVFRGRGMEFSEVRDYQPGDDIRSIDWNVTARVGKPFIKQFDEERERTILFVVDLSASGIFGFKQSKIDSALEAAATLMFSALKNNDKVGLLTFADTILRFYPPRKGRYHVLHLIRELIVTQPTGERTDLLSALEYVNRTQKRRSIVFVLSDFFVEGMLPDEKMMQQQRETLREQRTIKAALSRVPRRGVSMKMCHNRVRYRQEEQTPVEKALATCARKHDLIAMMLTDQREGLFPDAGLMTLQDAESGEMYVVDSSNTHVREALTDCFQNTRDHIDSVLKRCQIDQIRIDSANDFSVTLRKFFRQRERKRSS